MADIVLGIGTSHSPMLSTTPEQWPNHIERDKVNTQLWAWDGKPHTLDELYEMTGDRLKGQADEEKWHERYDACQVAIAKLGEVVADADVDVLVIVGDDQKEVIQDDNMPALLVYWGDTVWNKPRDRSRMPPGIGEAQWANEFDEPREFPVADELALHIIKTAMLDEFDLSHSSRLPNDRGEGHAFGFVHRRILNGRQIPIVPILQNTYYPPTQPTPNRCYDFGLSIRKAIESWDSDMRVGMVASGGMSHFVIDEDLDRRVLSALERKDEQTLRTLPLELMNSGNSEMRNWITVHAAVGDLKMKLVDYVPCYRTEASTGCAMGFAYWD